MSQDVLFGVLDIGVHPKASLALGAAVFGADAVLLSVASKAFLSGSGVHKKWILGLTVFRFFLMGGFLWCGITWAGLSPILVASGAGLALVLFVGLWLSPIRNHFSLFSLGKVG